MPLGRTCCSSRLRRHTRDNLFRNGAAINAGAAASTQQPIVNAVDRTVNVPPNTPTNATLRAPYQGSTTPGFQQFQYTAESAYNSLQMSLTRRSLKGCQLLASYTYARSLDNASGQAGLDTSTILGNQLDDAPTTVSPTLTSRIVRTELSVDLPRPAFASGQPSDGCCSPTWASGGIITAMSGQPFDIVDSAAGSFYFGANSGLSRPQLGAGRDARHDNQ